MTADPQWIVVIVSLPDPPAGVGLRVDNIHCNTGEAATHIVDQITAAVANTPGPPPVITIISDDPTAADKAKKKAA